MSHEASITLPWGDGRYTFCLKWDELFALQKECDAGPLVILSRLRGGTWRLEDIANVIRWGLVGGGQTPEKALSLVETYVQSRPPMENAMFAQGILNLAVTGPADQPLGKPPRRRKKATA